MAANESRGPDSLTILLYLLMAAVLLAAVGEFAGPFRGWFDRAANTVSKGSGDTTSVALRPPTPAPVQPVPAPPTPPTTAPEPAAPEPPKSEFDVIYDRAYNRALERLPRPEVGHKYTIKMINNMEVTGILTQMSPSRLVMEFPTGTMTLPVIKIHESSRTQLFPEETARQRALKEVDRIMHERQQPGSTRLPRPGGEAPLRPAGPQLAYDPTPATSPPEMKTALAEFGMWLEAQQHRLGGKLMDRIYAKQQGHSAVLYLGANDAFNRLTYDQRYQLTESLWRFWSMRCRMNRLIDEVRDAHIVLVGANAAIIGGSQAEDGTGLWVRD